MKKIILLAGILCFGLLIAGCSDPYIDNDKIFTITFNHDNAYYNGSGEFIDSGKSSMETDVKGRLSSLPSAPVKQAEPDSFTGEAITYAFTGWFTTGGTIISDKTVFHTDTMVIARWRASNEVDKDEPGPLAKILTQMSNSDLPPDTYPISIGADEAVRPQTLDFKGKNITIILGSSGTNIHTLAISGFGALFTVENGVTLELENIRLEGKRNTSSMIVINKGGKVIIKDGTTITMNGNENKEFGGAVTVNIGAELEMTGGKIINNYSVDPMEVAFMSTAGGGGVLVRGGKFTMTGGRIAENEGANGGGVLVNRGGVFTMETSEPPTPFNDDTEGIHKNFSYEGGGVKVIGAVNVPDQVLPQESTFTLKAGIIAENQGIGAGVTVGFRGIFNMHGGKIYKNLSGDAGGLYNVLGTVYMYGGEITENKGTWSAGGVMNQGFFYMYGGEVSSNFGGLGGGVTNFFPPVLGGGGWFHMWGGKISNNTGDGSGGGVVNDAWFYMHDGEISGNKTNMGMGGGVYNGNPAYEDDGVFVMTGGVVYGNSVKQNPPKPADPNDNIDQGGGSNGGAFHILGGQVVWGRRGYYDLDGTGKIRFTEDKRYEEDKVYDYEEEKWVSTKGRQFFPDISIGKPYIEGILLMDQEFVRIATDTSTSKQRSSNNTIEVVSVAGPSKVTGMHVEPGVYINGSDTPLVDFAKDPDNW